MTADTSGGGRRDLRQALIDAASAMLQETPRAPAPSLRAVARACNVSATAVYLHFDSWTALIEAVLEQHFTDARTQIEAATAAAGPSRERLDAFALAFVNWGLAHQGPYQLLFESIDWLKGTDAVRASLEEHVAAMADDLLAAGAVDDKAGALERAEQLWTALHGIVAGRRRQGRYVWHRSVADEVTGMVAIFAGASHGGSSAS
ncbi:TetR/AcrR family transcriptional regulator [Streptomyces sp. NPDC058200]|uniref:TetR/AcrR family transcriptional regulator n=1 Tax=Streptomyces sp. NPDC058200 TaxID=3346378 RepID=UPI0036E2292A